MSILVCLPFHKGDAAQAAELLRWIWELGPLPKATLLLAHDRSVSEDQFWTIRQLAEHAFGTVEVLQCNVDSFPRERERLWRPAANQMMKAVCRDMGGRVTPQPFLWLEGDCTPLRKGWLSDIESEYAKCGKPFMGTIVEAPRAGGAVKFLSGVAVNPANAIHIFGNALDGAEPWDNASRDTVLPLSHDTHLIQNFFCRPFTSFVKVKPAGSKDSIQTLEHLWPDAAIYHRCRDGSLIRLLREAGKACRVSDPLTTQA